MRESSALPGVSGVGAASATPSTCRASRGRAVPPASRTWGSSSLPPTQEIRSCSQHSDGRSEPASAAKQRGMYMWPHSRPGLSQRRGTQYSAAEQQQPFPRCQRAKLTDDHPPAMYFALYSHAGQVTRPRRPPPPSALCWPAPERLPHASRPADQRDSCERTAAVVPARYAHTYTP